jgi:hypothetical protein
VGEDALSKLNNKLKFSKGPQLKELKLKKEAVEAIINLSRLNNLFREEQEA